LKANQLDPDQALVKNQIGNYLAEDGRPLEALPYFMAAIKLEPKEPLYHYQLGTLLHEARDDFIKSGDWTPVALDHASHEAFGRAAALAPDRIEFTLRYAQSFADLGTPDWDGAMKAWNELVAKAPTAVERQFMQLEAANVLIKQGKNDEARVLLEKVTEPKMQLQKQKLVALLPAKAEK
jgi:tetratricopeptide (TPR) repeat protein